jgi:NAD(P)-dependent dehydrogenase (short-subunit alcohol dehydrogenase family)
LPTTARTPCTSITSWNDGGALIELIGKVAIVTGGASGIGAAACRAFAAEGAHIAVVDRDWEGCEAVATEVGGIAIRTDVGDEDSVNAMVAEVTAGLGPIDVCFSNAGIATGGDILETEPEVWREQWAINVMAHVYAVRAVLPGMLARGTGYLVHTASMAGILTSHGNVTYATTKHAVVGLTEWLSITYHHRGIGVSLLAPLGVSTPMLARADPRFATAVAGPIKDADYVAGLVVEAIRTERFLIVSDPIAETWMHRKTDDPERWLQGMRRVQEQLEQATLQQ